MSLTLQIIIGTIVGSWLIALCFKNFRNRCEEDLPDLLLEFHRMYKEDDTNGIFYKVFAFIAIYFIVYPIIIVIIIVSPIICGFVETFNLIKAHFVKNGQKDEPLKDWQIRQQEKERKQKEMEEWRDSHIKAFQYEGKVPFHFDRDTYLYLENTYNEFLNQCIERNLDVIDKVFKEYGFRFVYLPKWQPDKSYIHLTNLSDEQIIEVYRFLDKVNTVKYTHLLCDTLHIDKNEIDSGIFHFACYMYDDSLFKTEILQTRFTHFSMRDVTDETIEEFFRRYCEMITDSRNRPMGCFSAVKLKRHLSHWEVNEMHGHPHEDYADYTFPENMKDIAENIKKEIETLKEGGYFELLLHTLGNDTINELRNVKLNPSLSKIEITANYKIILSDYGKEVKLTPLQKTLYIFYLRHPEGVAFKMLSAYYDELLAIYKVLSNREDLEKQQHSIRRLVDATDNAINEKCSRIKEAFLKVSDDFIAQNYYICLKKEMHKIEGVLYTSLLKRITLPRELVKYPAEIQNIPILEAKENRDKIENDLKKQSNLYHSLNNRFHDKHYPKGKLIEEYTDFLNEYPKYYRAYFDRAILYTHVGRYMEAIADNDKLIDHNEWLWMESVINKAEALYFMKEYGLALKYANRYFELDEKPDAECYRIRSEIYRKLKMYEEYDADIKMMKKLKKEDKKLPF